MMNSITRKSRLIRGGIYLFLALAALAALALVWEGLRFKESMPGQGWNPQLARITGLVLVNLVFSALIAILAVLYLWVRMASGLPDLQGWHLEYPRSEFCENDACSTYTLQDYLEQENRVFRELGELISGPWASQSPGAYSKYSVDSVCNPETIVDRNWNRSFLLESPRPLGGVLLLHGLSDSPYSIRALGQRLHAEGYTVLWLRVPGHGTNPGALAHTTSEDWTAAVKIAMRGLRDRVPEGAPLILGGYSNGGALSVLYALSALQDKTLPKASAIVLLAPMIGINPLASLLRLYHTVALVSRNKKRSGRKLMPSLIRFAMALGP